MLLYRLQSHSNFSLPLIISSLEYLIFGKYHSSHTLGVNALLHSWLFTKWYSLFVCRIYEGIHPNYFLISWDSLVRFLLQRDGLVTWCFSATISLIGRDLNGNLCKYHGNFFWRCLCSWSRQWVWTNTVPLRTPRVTINEMSVYWKNVRGVHVFFFSDWMARLFRHISCLYDPYENIF